MKNHVIHPVGAQTTEGGRREDTGRERVERMGGRRWKGQRRERNREKRSGEGTQESGRGGRRNTEGGKGVLLKEEPDAGHVST